MKSRVFPGSRDSLMAQMVKSLPAMQETWIWSLGKEDPLEKEMATHTSILAWKNPMDGGARQSTVHGVAKSRTWLSDFTSPCSLQRRVCRYIFKILISSSLDIPWEVGLWDCLVVLFLMFWRTLHTVFHNVSLDLNQGSWLGVRSLKVWLAFSL